jgi:ribose 5-phosphate isomerase B
MRIAIASDHAGYDYKERLIGWLESVGHDLEDFGTNSEESVDYLLYVRPAAEAVAAGRAERGIVLGGSGNGEAMVANRLPGVRCALCWSERSARLARQHNDANMISLGQRLLPWELVETIVRTWLETPFEGGRHLPRIRMIDPPKPTIRDPE